MIDRLDTGARVKRSHVLGTSQDTTRISTARRVFSFLKPHRVSFVGAVICMAIFGATDGLVPIFIKFLLDGVFAEKNEHLLWILPVVFHRQKLFFFITPFRCLDQFSRMHPSILFFPAERGLENICLSRLNSLFSSV